MENLMTNNKVFYFRKRVLQFKKNLGLVTDDDIMNLFLGLVRLVKKNTEIIMQEKYLNKIAKLENELNRIKNKENGEVQSFLTSQK